MFRCATRGSALQHESVALWGLRSQRASEGYAERERYDLAAGERERARGLRLRAAALRLVCAAIDQRAPP